jgi:hypothetical protein
MKLDIKVGDRALWYRQPRGLMAGQPVERKEVTIVTLPRVNVDIPRVGIQWHDEFGKPVRRYVGVDNVQVIEEPEEDER